MRGCECGNISIFVESAHAGSLVIQPCRLMRKDDRCIHGPSLVFCCNYLSFGGTNGPRGGCGMLSTDWFGVRHSKPARKRSLFLIFGKKLTFVRGFRTEEGLGFYVGGGVDACGCGASRRLARCAGKRCAFPRLRALSGSNPSHAAQTKTAPLSELFQNLWWAMRDSNPQPCACKAPALTVAPIARGNIVYRNLWLEATMGFVFYPTSKKEHQ